jgi:hypothetical protein
MWTPDDQVHNVAGKASPAHLIDTSPAHLIDLTRTR